MNLKYWQILLGITFRDGEILIISCEFIFTAAIHVFNYSHLLFSLCEKEKTLQAYWNLNTLNNIVLCYVHHARSEKSELFHFKIKATLIKDFE